ncbi:NAD(P)/FAD-dependent oxidoreductase [Nocardioides sp.]|uniref:NAD(P)/FAD-dependent oxidoreductase n=1 Tax=Nocardioides sp. TaxID=35761 RepID=UPI002BE83FA8|nr:FAD-dependent monooxygenase [Nocardioides sp.]HXH79596.1 FAD-dependent monooxygenase [Nocardioides sp.]
MRDLIVAGGGPVGLAAALHAARAGLDVSVREPRQGPIDKACGEGLMPGALAELDALSVHPAGHRLDGIRYLDGSGARAEAAFRVGPGRGVRRTTLHAALSEPLADTGVKIDDRAVRSVRDEGDHLLVDGEATRYLVAADGLHSPVRRLLGLEVAAGRRRRFGLRCHVEQAPWTPFVEVHWSSGAEAYVTPVAGDLIGVALLTDAGTSFEDALEGFPVLRERLTGPRSKVMGAGPLRQRARRRVVGRVLLVGDAAGYVDALTGEGIAIGLAQARAAVGCVVAETPARYEEKARRIGRRHELLTHALLMATARQPVRRRLVATAARAPWVFSAAVNQLARPIEVPA